MKVLRQKQHISYHHDQLIDGRQRIHRLLCANESFSPKRKEKEDVSDFVEYEEEGWFERVGKAIFGVPIGILLIFATMACICWSEGRAVKRAKDLESGKGSVVSVAANKVDAKNKNKLVHMTGNVKVDETLTDSTFGVSQKAVKLERRVEMYQWVEEVKTTTKKKRGKRIKKKKYKYKKAWKSSYQNSDNFKDSIARREKKNPKMKYAKQEFAAKNATLGAFKLSPAAISKLSGTNKMSLDAVPSKIKDNKNFKLDSGSLYYGKNPSDPSVGDLRITYYVAKPDVISIVARQNGDRLEAYKTKKMSTSILLVANGKKSEKEMFKAAESANAALTWFLRIFTLVVLFAAFSMIFKPLSIIPQFVPLLGEFVGSLTGFLIFVVSAFLGFGVWLFTTAIAWIFARPLIGILLLVGAIAFFGGVIFLYIKNKD